MKDRQYDHQSIEKKWQERWEEQNLFRTKTDVSKPKFYYLDMFPYPSGDLHMGHMRNYVIGDVLSRYYTMNGRNVLHPMGYDAFGLPAETAAIERQRHPAEWTFDCIARMRKQFNSLGISFDWDREVVTCVPEYYRWNQWLFLKFLEKGLAYKKMAPANWCPKCETTLANEEAEGGVCWRCGSQVTKKDIEQWFFRITEYADRLLADIDLLDNWPERVCVMQRNWIGRSEGVEIEFVLEKTGEKIPVFTTRVDTIYGVTFMVLAPEHPLVEKLTAGTEYEESVRKFVQEVRQMSDIDRLSTATEKHGMFIGSYAINPMNDERVPIWVTNYVLLEYGTGGVMGVPAHDQRDFEFAKKYDLPIKEVIYPPDGEPGQTMEQAYTEPGLQVNSGPFDGMPTQKSKAAMADYMEERGVGRRTVHYRLRDWLISRQRYWGTPVPIVYCETCGMVPIPEHQLPVLLPTDVEFTGKGESPLAKSESFVNTTCPKCGGRARRDTDTMATWIDSSWYFLRYASPQYDKGPFDKEQAAYWLPVDQYVGGIEHAVLHLLYSRFFTKVIQDLGLISFSEPFARLFTQGMIYKDGYKMSKSRGNVVAPDYINQRYGADTGRMFILFVGPPDQDAEWNDQGIEGVYRFLNRVWRTVTNGIDEGYYIPEWRNHIGQIEPSQDLMDLRRKVHQTISKVTRDIVGFHFNTAVSSLMELMNTLMATEASASKNKPKHSDDLHDLRVIWSEAVENLALILSPFAPHLADELWEQLGKSGSAYQTEWPGWDEAVAKEEQVTVVVQVNGKVRDRLVVPADTPDEDLRQMALASDKVKPLLDGTQIRNVIVVPKKLVNIVIG
ncbi:MAG: leucine--tRNA ligase [Armatimonadota bacterium]|nr:leucine--tRNA ligase [Armatimonadota bacterium]